MPNHLHGIIFISLDNIVSTNCKGGSRTAPTSEKKMKSLGRLIGAFKTISTKQINFTRQISGAPFWQRNFYEHVIRDDLSLNRIREYVVTNPLQWDLDRENPQAQGRDEFAIWLATFKKPPTRASTAVGAVREPPYKAQSRK